MLFLWGNSSKHNEFHQLKSEERLESLFIINYKLHVQDETLYRLGYTCKTREN